MLLLYENERITLEDGRTVDIDMQDGDLIRFHEFPGCYLYERGKFTHFNKSLGELVRMPLESRRKDGNRYGPQVRAGRHHKSRASKKENQ